MHKGFSKFTTSGQVGFTGFLRTLVLLDQLICLSREETRKQKQKRVSHSMRNYISTQEEFLGSEVLNAGVILAGMHSLSQAALPSNYYRF